MTEATKQEMRDSILNHLGTLQSFGVNQSAIMPVNIEEAPKATIIQPTQEPMASKIETPQPKSESQLDLNSLSSLDDLQSHLSDCQRCKLCENRKTIVFGVGLRLSMN